ncbi:MAG: hypothetical protein QHJ73_02485 [Armatimonadota bacterium]|nr:hypothetical protein [Armatimonadota bacterium]
MRYRRRSVPALVAAILLVFAFLQARGRLGRSGLSPDAVVYATASGDRFHLAGCSALGESRVRLTYAEALARGLAPCQLCVGRRQPEAERSSPLPPPAETVYVTHSGKKYHRLECSALAKTRDALSVEEARQRGYQPCEVCRPPR